MSATATELSHKDFLKVDRDYTGSAEAASLLYVSDKEEGILREKKGTGFAYSYKGKPVTDEATLGRIKSLVIPPAWTNVWICKKPTGHIQATGFDARGRKQYRYHPGWHTFRNETKFHRLFEFGKLLPLIRKKVEADLKGPALTEEKVLATVVSLMERTSIRIGNEDYAKANDSYGLSTMKDRHVTVSGSTVKFSFRGKKGVSHDISIRNRKLAKLVQRCKDIPGKELFQYYDAEGVSHPIDSGMVNRYIKEATGGDFTAKDFRTWTGTLAVLDAFCTMGGAETDKDCKKNVVAALDEVSKSLGNTRTVCKKYYVHPGVIKLYEEKGLERYLKELDGVEKEEAGDDLTGQEKTLMKILKSLV